MSPLDGDDHARIAAGRKLRRDTLTALSDALAQQGQRLRVEGHIFGDGRVSGSSPNGNGDDRRVAFGYLCEAASAIQAGMLILVDADNIYAPAALIRHMVEIEYLASDFHADESAAATWLNATPADLRSKWQPRHTRARVPDALSARHYWLHSDFGGHPTPQAVRTYVDPTDAVAGESLVIEAIAHGTGVWGRVTSTFPELDEPSVSTALSEWRDADPLIDWLNALPFDPR